MPISICYGAALESNDLRLIGSSYEILLEILRAKLRLDLAGYEATDELL